jgi:hypothetical protein
MCGVSPQLYVTILIGKSAEKINKKAYALVKYLIDGFVGR